MDYDLFGEPIEAKRTRQEVFEDYEGFVDKFKPKLTTDDCYTPEAVYEAVRQWVDGNLLPLEGVEIVRPFYPGGDYKRADYPRGCLVLDNPPFSILASIRRYYHSRGIRYFLFCPALTCAGSCKELAAESCFVMVDEQVVYANGAKVATAFVTNIETEAGLIVSGSLNEAIRRANAKAKGGKAAMPRYAYPDNALTPARVMRYAKSGGELAIGKGEMCGVSKLDSQREAGKELFGGGWLVSNAAAERAASERAASERGAVVWELSDRERAIIAKLGNDNAE